ncbi:MAG: glycosyltransferase family 9 protein [bacterium]|nr:glycosyltransferase family 9 protein [bacterium]
MFNGSPRILIVRLSAIGDVVRVIPALHVLREAFPDARIDWAVEAKAARILERHPALDEVLVFQRPPGAWSAFRDFVRFCLTLRANRYDIVVDFHGIFKSAAITALSGARKRHGFARPRSQEGSFLVTNRKVALPSQDMNRVAENLALCESLAPNREFPNLTIHVPKDIRQAVDRFFEETFDGGKLVVAMHVPMDRDEKRWPEQHFAALADQLLADGRFEVLLTWGPGQREVAQRVLDLARRSPVVAPETLDLKQYAWLAHRADLYFGGDTGPMHIAWMMGTPVVAVFGGTDPAKHAPYHQSHLVLGGGQATDDDVQERLNSITPDMAYDACVELLAEKLQLRTG